MLEDDFENKRRLSVKYCYDEVVMSTDGKDKGRGIGEALVEGRGAKALKMLIFQLCFKSLIVNN